MKSPKVISLLTGLGIIVVFLLVVVIWILTPRASTQTSNKATSGVFGTVRRNPTKTQITPSPEPTIEVIKLPEGQVLTEQTKEYATAQQRIYETEIYPSIAALMTQQNKEENLIRGLPHKELHSVIWYNQTDREFGIQLYKGEESEGYLEVLSYLKTYSFSSYNELSSYRIVVTEKP
jgi:hypothetical protein